MSQQRGQQQRGNIISNAQLTYAQKVKKGNTPPQSKQAQQQQRQSQPPSQQAPPTQPQSQQVPPQQQQRSAAQPPRQSSRQGGNPQRVPSRQRHAAQAQHQHPQAQQVRMLPVHQQTAQLFAAPTIQQYTYPYNYTNLQQQMNRGGYGPNAYYPRHAQPPQQARAPPSYGGGGGGGAGGQQRDFFDRKVQSNVTSAVNQYYNYPQQAHQARSRNQGGPPPQQAQAAQQQQLQAAPPEQEQAEQEQAGAQRQHKPYNNPTYSGARFRDTNTRYNNRRSSRYSGYSGGGGYSGNNTNFQPPSYVSSSRPSYGRNRNDARSSARYKRRGNAKPTESQLRTYEAAADRDVLCWIYENQGRCRYGEKCQWLHLDRETGQYVPTVYIMNSLESTQYRGKENQPSSSSTGDRKEETEPNDGDDDKDNVDDEEEPTGGKEKEANSDKAKEKEKEKEVSPEELSKKFQILMAKSIQQKIDGKEEKQVDQNEEDNKQAEKKKGGDDDDDDDKDEQKKNGDEANAEDKAEENGAESGDKAKKPKYGTYGTTFDKQNVCWEFNTFVGCRKGTKCKWAHQYLIAPNAVHPYTGEKLNGLAVRKFRIANDL